MKIPNQVQAVAKTTRDARINAGVSPSVDWPCILQCGGTAVLNCFMPCLSGGPAACLACVMQYAPQCAKCF